MPSKRSRNNSARSVPYDRNNINNWYSEQFRAKLAEWDIIAPASYSKAELKSLYMANLSHRSRPDSGATGQIQTSMSIEREVSMAQNSVQGMVPAQERQRGIISSDTQVQQQTQLHETQGQIQSGAGATMGASTSQDSIQASVIVNMMSTMNSIIDKFLNKDEKEDNCRKTLEQFSVNRLSGNEILPSNSSTSSSYGIHPEQLKNVDYVSESVRDKIISGKYVNLATLLIPEFEQTEKKDKYRDARLNRSLSVDEFIVAFSKYKRIHCSRHPWRREELDEYMENVVEIARVYGRKFYEYHKFFSQKCAVALEQGKKVSWAEKDKNLLQMIIGGTLCNSCNICKEVSHTTQFCPQNANQLVSQPKYQNALASSGSTDSLKTTQRRPICHFFNSQGCKKDKCYYLHACKSCGSVAHGMRQCTSQQIPSLTKPVSKPGQPTAKKN